MRFFSIISILTTVVVAQNSAVDISVLPVCSLTCFETGASQTGCQLNDYVCQCTTGKAALTASVTPCVQKNCDADDQQRAAAAAISICSEALGGGATTSSAAPAATATKTSNAAAVYGVRNAMAGAGLLAALAL